MDFQLPELGEGVYEAELTSWLVKPGDAVKRGQNLMEVMTDKATMEVPAPFAGGTAPEGGPVPAEPAADYGKPGSRIPLRGVRRVIAEHMVHAKQTIPHYTYVDECDVTELVRLRESLRDTFSRAGLKLTYLP